MGELLTLASVKPAWIRPSGPEYKRMMFIRDPTHRAASGFHQMLAHYLMLLRLPPSALNACIDQWPEDVEMLEDAIPHFSGDCKTAFTTEAQKGTPLADKPVATRNQTIATKDSALLEHLWYLPKGCHFSQVDLNMSKTYTNDVNKILAEPDLHHYADPWVCGGDDCREACEISDQQYAELLSHALSDTAKANTLGCGSDLFAGEHMLPQIYHIAHVGRVDYTLRLENLE